MGGFFEFFDEGFEILVFFVEILKLAKGVAVGGILGEDAPELFFAFFAVLEQVKLLDRQFKIQPDALRPVLEGFKQAQADT